MTVKTISSGHIALDGPLTFATVPNLLIKCKSCFTKDLAQWVLDLAAVTSSDSAGIALLLELKREAKRQKKCFTITNIPSQLQRIAEVTGVQELLLNE